MKRQKKIFFELIVILSLAVASLMLVKYYNQKQEEKKEEEAAIEQVALTQFNEDEITAIDYDFEDVSNVFSKTDGIWQDPNDPDTQYDQSYFKTMVEALTGLTSTRVIGKVEDLAQYGLDNPRITITVQCENSALQIMIGDYNDTLDEYYVMTGDSEVYMMDHTLVDAFSYNKESLLEKETSENSDGLDGN